MLWLAEPRDLCTFRAHLCALSVLPYKVVESLRYIGVERNQLWAELTASAYNLVHMSKLLAEVA